MYQTPNGVRILEGAERTMYEESLGVMVDFLATGDFNLGVAAFDELQRGPKLAALYQSARALLRPDEPAPERTAYLEAAIASVYRHVFAMIEIELNEEINEEDPDSSSIYWRKLVSEAANENDDIEASPPVEHKNLAEWDLVIECLAETVLADRDFEIQEHLDADPASSHAIKATMGIPPNYYAAIPIDPPEHQLNLYMDALMGLTPRGRGEYISGEEHPDGPSDGHF